MKEKGTGASSGKSGARNSAEWKRYQEAYRAYKKAEKEFKAKGGKSFGVDTVGSLYKMAKKDQFVNPAAGKKAKKK